MEQLVTRKKHIKIANRSDFGWGTVAHYQEDSLASGPDDEKETDKAESRSKKDAKKDVENSSNKQTTHKIRNKSICGTWHRFQSLLGVILYIYGQTISYCNLELAEHQSHEQIAFP